jgi:hypothetical protein
VKDQADGNQDTEDDQQHGGSFGHGKSSKELNGYSFPRSASQRSASRAAMQPVPAAVTAWR